MFRSRLRSLASVAASSLHRRHAVVKRSATTTHRGLLHGLHTLSAVYLQHGEPGSVLQIREEELDENCLKPTQVLLRFLAAPVNPADVNQIQGVYPIKPKQCAGVGRGEAWEEPAVGGNEGVAEVVRVGGDVGTLKPKDRVLPAGLAFGTWRTHAIGEEEDLLKVASSLPVEMAATLAVNPASAFRMLQDFVHLPQGSTVVQNAATSSVGRYVIQLCKARNINSINIIRARADPQQTQHTKDQLLNLGATVVLTEEEVRGERKRVLKELGGGRGAPLLGLNAVGGKSSLSVASFLTGGGDRQGQGGEGGGGGGAAPTPTLVTYGGMSRQPVMMPTGSLIFNDVQVRGFWLSRWAQHAGREARVTMLDELTRLVEEGALHSQGADMERVSIEDLPAALRRRGAGGGSSSSGSVSRKILVDLTLTGSK